MTASGRPRVPLAPVLSHKSFMRAAGMRPASVLDAGPARLVTSGRIAIAMALREMNVGSGDLVLVPAYHSLSMIPPLLACGAEPVFYKVGANAQVDLADAQSRLGARVKAIMVTSYFGMPQELARIRTWCDQHRILMLEDCAHCFFGQHQGQPVGSWGDYAIASSMKFFPIYEGGCLVSAHHALKAPALRGAGKGFEVKAGLNALEHAFAYRRLPLIRALLWLPMQLKSLLWGALKRRAPVAALAPSSSDSSVDFDPHWVDLRSSWFSRMVMRRASHQRIVARRRAHYQHLSAALSALPGCRPLFASLPEHACPWLFPLVVEDADILFGKLHQAGVPMTRFAQTLWPGVDERVCANSAYLSRHVLAFPCHQELEADELAWMTATIRAAALA
ncbi:MAG: DegT/DnrJ/EryC1/StrS family aminotransferase [Pseudomonadota bacterium]